MENLGEFIVNHWILSSLFVLFLVLTFSDTLNRRLSGVHALDVAQSVNVVNQSKGLFIDIRDAEAFGKSHITDALNLPLPELDKHLLKGKLKNPETPLIVVCDNGHRSRQAVKTLRSKGYSQVFVMQGGLHAWREAKLPLLS